MPRDRQEQNRRTTTMFQDDLYHSASRICSDNGWEFADIFKYQFRVSMSPDTPCASWDSTTVADWQIHHCPALPRHNLQFEDGTHVGVVLGVGVDADGTLLDGTHVLQGASTMDHVEAFLSAMAGRFLAIVAVDGTSRVYFDPSAGLTAVYSARDRILASSVHVLADRDLDPRGTPDTMSVLNREAMFLLGETADLRCARIFANHYLDLETFELVRHWPGPEDRFDEDANARDDIANGIATRLATIMTALSRGYRSSLPVSGGADSRILLSACSDCLSDIDRFYIHHIYKVTRFDLAAAKALTDHLNIPLHVINRDDPSFDAALSDEEVEEQCRKMAVRTSLGFGGIDAPTVRAVHLAPQSDLILRGNVGEMSRANKWTPETCRKDVSTEEGLATLLSLNVKTVPERLTPKRHKDLLERYDAWSKTVPEAARARLPDIAHCEVFMPGAPNNVYYAFERSFYINPYNDRSIIQWTAQFHPLARKRGRLIKKIIGVGMPSLNGIPYLKDFKQAHKARKTA